jgi:polyisoprenoid-binding protein YceI
MKKFKLSLTLFIVCVTTVTQAAEFNQALPGKSTLTFAYKQMGVPMEGKFGKFSARIAFDPSAINTAHARLEVDMSSIDTGYREGNDEVAGKLWFNTPAHPVAQFVSGSVKHLGGNRYETLGKLTLKGRTLDISAPFTFKQEGSVGIFDGAFTLKRLDYSVGEGLWADVGTVANEIRIVFHLEAFAALPVKK